VNDRFMDVSRILVVQDNTEPSRELRLTAFGHPVEFDFRSSSEVLAAPADAGRYDAVVASLDSDHRALIDSIRDAPGASPPVFLFRSEPPLQEVARWAAWTKSRGDDDSGDPAAAARLLSESVEYYSLAALYQQCLKIMGSQDEEKLLSLVADTFRHELGVDGCVIWLASPSDPDEMMIRSVRGMIGIDREGSRFFLSQSEQTDAIHEGKPFAMEAGPSGGGWRAGGEEHLYVPLLHREKPIGLVKLGGRTDRKPFGDRDVYVARVIAGYAASSWMSLSRIARMEKVSLRDPETRAYSMGFLSDYFEKERYKAGRFRRPLSLLFLVLDNYSTLMEGTRESLVAAALAEVVAGVAKALRDSDLVARADSNRLCVVLPETDGFGGLLASRRLRKTIVEKSRFHHLGTEHAFRPFCMAVTFPRDGRNLDDLWGAAERKYQRQRRSAFHRLHLGEKTLWDAFDVLVGRPEYYDLLRQGKDVPYFARIRRDLGRNGHFRVDRRTFLRIVESVAQDIGFLNGSRGLVIAAGPRPEIFKQIFLSFGPQTDTRRNIYVVGRAGSTRFDSKNLLYVAADDDRLADREIVLLLKENGAYGLLGLGSEDEVCGFNTTDEVLVDSMMEKIQNLYHLQGNF
jgi:diguanylate cyclase (GGDEF)-like protein